MPQQLEQFLTGVFPFLFVAAFVWVFGCIAFMLWRHKARGVRFPNRNDVNVLFEERWASGRSYKSLFTRFGGASNCLRVTVTEDELWVTLRFPFSAMAAQLDLEHRIPRDAITKIEQNHKIVSVVFTLDVGEERRIDLQLRKADQFLAALQPST